ncbi:MAG: hypothetical protein KF841_04840 [Phycisphaerae bacterium]|nr:hypothetical protein [Phycisphaerae bacterium]
MPLNLKCSSCGRMLVLEEAFQGARCRCKYCRQIVDVPRASAVPPARSGARPDSPASLADTLTAIESHSSGHYVEALPTRRPGVAAQPAGSRQPLLGGRITAYRIIASFSLVAAAILGFVVWTVSSDGNGRPPRATLLTYDTSVDNDGSDRPAPRAADNPRLAIRNSDPLHSYFGIPVEGGTIGYVVDWDATMSPYADRLALVTNGVNQSLGSESTRFGIVQAVENPDGLRLYEVFEPSTDLAGASAILHGRIPSGMTDLPRAFSVTESWYANEIFLVLSKQLSTQEIEFLSQLAEQSGAVTHVIALGDAAADTELARISDATGGQFVPVADDVLDELVSLHEAVAEASQK